MDDMAALAALLAERASVDGAPDPKREARLARELVVIDLQHDSLAVFGREPGGSHEMAAACWLRTSEHVKSEFRIFIHGRVAPDHRGRGLGAYLLAWAEARARELVAPLEDGRRQVLRLDFYDEDYGADAMARCERFLESRGFRFTFAEDEMRCRLDTPVPATSTTVALGFTTWAAATADRFFTVYSEAFRTRPGFPDWSEDVWVSALTGGDDFQPDLSLLVSVDGVDVGYGITHVQPAGHLPEGAYEIGWIAQMGVRPEWRRKGIAGALLATLLQRYQIAGLRVAALDVNVNNPHAASVYDRLGFRRVRRCVSRQKEIGGA